ncbi:AAA family ATPase [Zavarzinia compransoris]|nr:AAA family ATPase [Zavarzinia compransoris]TDP45524.1 AAA domain-containing protein [Zavarzinia compransoris]
MTPTSTGWMSEHGIAPGPDQRKPMTRDRAIVDSVLPGFGETGTVGFMAGPSGAGTSTVLMHLAHCVATDRPFFGRDVLVPGGTLIVAGSDINGHLWRRTAQKRRSGDPTALPICVTESPGVSLTSADGRMWLEAEIEDVKAHHAAMGTTLRLVVIDALRLCLFLRDENSNAEATAVMNQLRAVSQAHGVVVLVAHHFPKAGRKLAGARAFATGSDFVLFVEMCKAGRARPAARPSASGPKASPTDAEISAMPPDALMRLLWGADDDAPTALQRRTLSVEKSSVGPAGPIGDFEIHADVMRRQPLPKGKVRTIWGTYIAELSNARGARRVGGFS